MSVEQTIGGEGRVACGTVRCAGTRPYGAAPAAGVRTMWCDETTRRCVDLTAVGGSRDPAAGAGERPRLEIQRFLIYVHPDSPLWHSQSTIRG
jgi:hypothetical protein